MNKHYSIDNELQGAVADGAVPHVVAMAAGDDGVVYEGAFGLGVTPDSLFWIASLTKAITAVACMRLVEQGSLRLDQLMGEVLPKLRSPRVLDGFDADGRPRLRPAKSPITLRHLLTHTAGFTYSIWSDAMARYLKLTGVPFITTCRKEAFDAPLEFDPGERWEYGINMDWVGQAIEAVTGQSLDVHLREQIFAPLGMADTGYLLTDAQRRRFAPMYRRGKDGGLVRTSFEMPQQPEFFMGGGALFSTPREYLAFLEMLLHDGSRNGVQILRPDTVRLMRQNHIGALNVGTLRTANPADANNVDLFPGTVHKWGLSFDINTEPGPNGRGAGSIAWAGGHNTYYWVDYEKHVAAIFMTQLEPFPDPDTVAVFDAFERALYAA